MSQRRGSKRYFDETADSHSQRDHTQSNNHSSTNPYKSRNNYKRQDANLPRFRDLYGSENQITYTKTDPNKASSSRYSRPPRDDRRSRNNRDYYSNNSSNDRSNQYNRSRSFDLNSRDYNSNDTHVYDFSGDRRLAQERREKEYLQSQQMQGRKKRRYIRGGAIPKHIKAQEYSTADLYCDVCDRAFRDEAAKSGHDRSKDHIRNQEYKRREEENRQKQDKIDNQNTSNDHDFAEDKIRDITKNLDRSKLPGPFNSWTDRSLKAAQNANDKIVRVSVYREIIAELEYHQKNCTLQRESWDRKPIATGQNYRKPVVKKTKNLVIHESQLVPSSRFEQASDLVTFNSKNSDNIQNTSRERVAADSLRREDSTRLGRQGASSNEALFSSERSSANVVQNENGQIQQQGNESTRMNLRATPKRRVQPRKYSQASLDMLDCCCSDKDPELLRRDYMRQFYISKKNNENLKQKVPVDSIMRKYEMLLDKYKNEAYEYNQFCKALDEVIADLSSRGTRYGTIGHCLQLKVCVAIEQYNFLDCLEPCSKMIDLYDITDEMDDVLPEFIGHWLISLLFRLKESMNSRYPKNTSHYLTIASELRKMPVGAVGDARVASALDVLRAVFTNNYVSFFKVYSDLNIHSQTNMRSQKIMDGLVDHVRERAIMTMCLTSTKRENPVYDYPTLLPMSKLIHLLGWENCAEDEDEKVEEVQEFLNDLNPRPALVRGEDGHETYVKCDQRTSSIRDSEEVIVQELLAWSDNACKLRVAPAP